ncbi:MAG: FAD-binding oxidoreductase [Myxococcales bacterium]|nr:FAD-binding oxidoreductase [Myxococcales bacterium]
MTLPPSATRRLAGWGHFPVEECDVYRPERRDELRELVLGAPQPSVIARGLGRAYGDAALNRGGAVLLGERLDRMLDFDPETGVLWCEAAVSLADILDVFLPQGFFFPVTPGTKFITLGGAIAADVHGKNHHHSGSISAFLEDFRLLTASGDVLDCSRTQNADVFWATTGGMGLTGVVLDARIRLMRVESAYVTVDYEKCPNLDAVLESFLLNDHKHHYVVTWIDCLARGRSLGRSVVMRANHTPHDELPEKRRAAPFSAGPPIPLAVPFPLPNGTLNPFTVRAFNTGFYHAHRDGRFVTDCNRFFYPLDRVRAWNRAYGTRGAIQYQALIPRGAERAGVVALLEEISRANWPAFLAVLKSLGDASGGLLSFPRPGITLTLDMPAPSAKLLEVVARLDDIVLRHGGCVYLAKDSCLHAESLRAMYPELGRFRDLKAKVDPENRFSSSLGRRLGLVDG